jgi:hypothetical protein
MADCWNFERTINHQDAEPEPDDPRDSDYRDSDCESWSDED